MIWRPLRVEVRKVRKTKVKTTRDFKRLQAKSLAMEKAVRLDLVRGITTFKNRVSAKALAEAIATGGVDALRKLIPWDRLSDDLGKATRSIGKAVLDAGAATVPTVPAPKDVRLRFDINNPGLQKYIAERAGSLITGITDEQRGIIQRAVTSGFERRRTPLSMAKEIRGSIGLNERQATAVQNYRNKLAEDGATDARADKLTGAYQERLLDQRAFLIARTETAEATSQGQLAVWTSALDQGLIEPSTQKQWVINAGACPKICLPMDGKSVPVTASWQISDGKGGVRLVDTVTQAHPGCRCGQALLFDESDRIRLGGNA